jgi:hypothetical protein
MYEEHEPPEWNETELFRIWLIGWMLIIVLGSGLALLLIRLILTIFRQA